MDVFDLSAKIRLDSSQYEQGLKQAGQSATNFGASFKKILGGLAIGATVKKSFDTVISITKRAVDAYAQYEQLVGGVDTLFKGSSARVQKYADSAYKTAGLSANEYMQTVTSFSAGLIKSLKGDTDRAADVADMAVRDMSDNANKMGTDMTSIQNAYQGFAKQNYTMLDNLKLGYGGTKTEMQRLLKDAGKITGKKYNLKNLSDVYEAIHVIQTEMGITGTTALEASKTIEGSQKAMKASWQDLMVAFVKNDDTMADSIQTFVSSVFTFLGNVLPAIRSAVSGLLSAIPQLVKSGAKKIWKDAAKKLRESGNEALSNIGIELTELRVALAEGEELDFSGLLASLVAAASAFKQKAVEQVKLAIEAIPEAINDFFTNANTWLSSDSFSTFEETFFGLLKDAVSFKSGGGAAKVIEGLTSIFDNLDWPTILASLSNVSSFVFKGLQTAIEGSAYGLVLLQNALGNAVSTALDKIQEADVKAGITNLLTTVVKGIGNLATSTWTGIGTLATNLAEVIRTALTPERLRGAGAALKEIGQNVLQALIDSIGAAADAAGGALGAIGGLVEAIGGLIQQALSEENLSAWLGEGGMLTDIGGKLIDAIADGIGNVGTGALSIAEKLGDLIAGIDWSTVGEKLTSTATNLIDKLFGTLTSADFDDAAQTIGNLLGDAFKAAVDLGMGIGGTILKWLIGSDVLEQVANAGRVIATKLSRGIGEALLESENPVIKYIGQMLTDLADLLDEWHSRDMSNGAGSYQGVGTGAGAGKTEYIGPTWDAGGVEVTAADIQAALDANKDAVELKIGNLMIERQNAEQIRDMLTPVEGEIATDMSNAIAGADASGLATNIDKAGRTGGKKAANEVERAIESVTPTVNVRTNLVGGVGGVVKEKNARAMNPGRIFRNPTVFGYAEGAYQVAGEAGPEAVIGTSSLSRMVDDSARQGVQMAMAPLMQAVIDISQYMPQIANRRLVMPSSALGSAADRELGKRAKYAERRNA